jgi:thiamine pyrophosphokinase
MAICYIVGAASVGKIPELKPGDFLIAADGGYRNLGGRRPDLVVGDFDSLGFVPEDVPVLRYPVQKDDTDMMLAAKFGLEHGYSRFFLLGGLGGRSDHTVANFHVLAYLADYGARGCLVGGKENIFLLKSSFISFAAGVTGTISVFAWGGDAHGVTLSGLEYPLTDASLTGSHPLGVSNAFTGAPSRITVSIGRLLVITDAAPVFSDWFSKPN